MDAKTRSKKLSDEELRESTRFSVSVELRVSPESMFCLTDLLRLDTMLKRKVYVILEMMYAYG
jgi:hypothetical protein